MFTLMCGPLLWMSVDTGDGDQLPVTTAARPLTSGSGCCGWLQFVTQGVGPVAPPKYRTDGVLATFVHILVRLKWDNPSSEHGLTDDKHPRHDRRRTHYPVICGPVHYPWTTTTCHKGYVRTKSLD